MIMYAMRFPKGLHQYHWKQEFRYYSECLPQKNIEQAIERAGTKAGNKGYDCALSAIEMVNLIKEFEA